MSYSDRDKTLSVRVSQELLDKLDEKANSQKCTRTDYILAVLAQDIEIKIEPSKVWGEERIIALEKKLAEVENKIISPNDVETIVGTTIKIMKMTGHL